MSYKNEYKYANLLFTGTIVFLILLSLLGIDRMLGYLLPTGDYVVAAIVSAVKYSCVTAAYLVLVRKKIFAYPGKTPAEEAFARLRLKKISLPVCLFSIVFGLAIQPLLYFINGLSLFFVKDVTVEKAADSAEKYPFLLFFIALAIIPPVVEESIYRGVYLGVYSKAGAVKGILLSALLFALMHSNFNQFAYAFIAGSIFAAYSYISGSIFASIILHMMVNGISTCLLYYPDIKLPSWMKVLPDSLKELFNEMALPMVIGTAAAAAAFALVMHLNKRNNSDTIINQERVIDGTLLIGIIAMVAGMLALEFAN